jgi:uncharacterized protein involved in exopolysaccharide biosynthesis
MSEGESRNDSLGGVPQDADGGGLLGLLIVLAKHKRLLLVLPAIAFVLSIIGSLLATPIWTGKTKILLPQGQQSSLAMMLGQLGGLVSAATGGTSVRSSSELFVSMLKSRTIADNLVKQFDLAKLYGWPTLHDARIGLERKTTIVAGREGIITIEVEDIDPKRAAEIANAYVDELLKLTRGLAVTEASQRRVFFEQQLLEAKNNLAKAEIAANKGLETGGLVKVDDYGRTLVETMARLRAQIYAKEIQIGSMRTFATDESPDLRMALGELSSMKEQLAKLEGAAPKTAGNQASAIGQGIDNMPLLRDLKYYETLYEIMARQYEVARIDEARDSAVVQVMDKAIVPDYRTRPKRALTVIVSTIGAFVLAVLIAFILEIFENAMKDPDTAERWRTLRGYLSRTRKLT